MLSVALLMLNIAHHMHFEGSEMSSKVRDFRQKIIATKVRDLRPILNLHPQYFLNPQSSIQTLIIILNPQSKILNVRTHRVQLFPALNLPLFKKKLSLS